MTDKDPINQLAQDVKYLHRLADALRNNHRISLCTFDSQGPLYIEVDEGLAEVIHQYMVRVIRDGSEKAVRAWHAIPLGQALIVRREK